MSAARFRVECWDCGGEGFSYHDCGEDCCCCLDPEPNVVCDTCGGKGYWDTDKMPTNPDLDWWEIEPEATNSTIGGTAAAEEGR